MKKGFTLVELLIVVFVITSLLFLLVPKLLGMKENSIDTAIKSDLRELASGIELYNIDNEGIPSLSADMADMSFLLSAYLKDITREYEYMNNMTPACGIESLGYYYTNFDDGTNDYADSSDTVAVLSAGLAGASGNNPSGNCTDFDHSSLSGGGHQTYVLVVE